ncbi:MAG: ABC transporter substrate-binding protein, partial [Pirellulales bacterium]|nr:ABC transporter substrate-binding protein [Pirellulales bacterium]
MDIFRRFALLSTIVTASFAVAPAIAQETGGTVKIGLNESLSGNFQAVGLPPAAAVRMAIKEINDAGGFTVGGAKYTLELIEADNQSQPASAMAGITKLVEDDGVKFVFGPTQSALAIQTAEVTQPAAVIHFSAATLWQSKGLLADPTKPLLFGTQQPTGDIVSFEVAALEMLGVKKIVLLTQDDETSKSIFPSFIPAIEAAGIEVEIVLFPTDTNDFASHVSRAKAAAPDAIFFFWPQARVNEVLRSVIDLQAAGAFGGRGLNPNAAISGATGGAIPLPFFSSYASPNFEFPPNEKVQDYRERLLAFEPAVAGAFGSFSFWGYDFVPMLVEAMKRA